MQAPQSPPPTVNVRTAAIALGIVVVLVVAIVVAVLAVDRDVSGTATPAAHRGPVTTTTGADPDTRDPGAADVRVGDCVNYRQLGGDNVLAKKIDCAAPMATYRVGFRVDDSTTEPCPTDSYDQYTQTGPDGDFMLCLIMNGDTGECFNGYSTSDEMKAKVDCAGADVTVSAKLDDRVDPSICPPSSGWRLLYPEPAPGATMCLDPLNGG